MIFFDPHTEFKKIEDQQSAAATSATFATNCPVDRLCVAEVADVAAHIYKISKLTIADMSDVPAMNLPLKTLSSNSRALAV